MTQAIDAMLNSRGKKWKSNILSLNVPSFSWPNFWVIHFVFHNALGQTCCILKNTTTPWWGTVVPNFYPFCTFLGVCHKFYNSCMRGSLLTCVCWMIALMNGSTFVHWFPPMNYIIFWWIKIMLILLESSVFALKKSILILNLLFAILLSYLKSISKLLIDSCKR